MIARRKSKSMLPALFPSTNPLKSTNIVHTMDDLATILARIKKPLEFAAKDSFAHVKSLSNLEPFMRVQMEELKKVLPGSNVVADLEQAFSNFDSLSNEQKIERIRKASLLIEKIGRNATATTSLMHTPTAKVTPHPVPLPQGERVSKAAVLTTGAAQGERMLKLDTAIQYCKGIGPKRAEILRKIGINTIEDALMYLPWRYEDRGNLKKIGRVSYGAYETVQGKVVSAEVAQTRRARVKIFELVITDGSGMLVGSWFNQPFMKKAFREGQNVLLTGVVKSNPYKGGLPQIDNPDYEIMEDDEAENLIHSGRTVPIYRATAGLSVRFVRSMVKEILDSCGSSAQDLLPPEIVKRRNLMPMPEALFEVHFPSIEKDIATLNRGTSAAHRRLSFEELFALELGLAIRKRGVAAAKKGIQFRKLDTLEKKLRQALLFTLTNAQERVIADIKKDMLAEQPMNRLVQGDVGSGKTIVALIASLLAVENGYQACIMAPTEILADQHFKNITLMAESLGVTVASLTGRKKKKEKELIIASIESGEAKIVIGTHALIESGVKFKNLGLAVIDEQHRFGVMQRSTLTSKGYDPDVLVMTATPIPRTLALTVYGDLDVSVIDEMPKGRLPIVTRLFFENKRQEAYQFLETELKQGRQVYVVYPLVEETEKSDLKAATEMAAHLQKDIFPKWRVGLLHGRMKADEKEAAMAEFKAGGTNILVSTTVIEVGVDVPNATVMVIEHPERFGLAQLHQLRGRVGRGIHQSYCILMGPRMFAEETKDRLMSFTRTNDGFRIAEEDLRLRGPGEFFGTRQSGLPDLRAANIIRDADLLEQARDEAFQLLDNDPHLSRYPDLKELVRRKWQGKLGLISVG
jgi:ATP-dependent DNA helicase RecG